MGTIVDISASPQFSLDEQEVFELLVFSKLGTVYIQTNKSLYCFLDKYYFAAKELHRLINGEPTTKLDRMDRLDRIDNPTSAMNQDVYLCIGLEKITEALNADKVTSDWNTSVVAFFDLLISIDGESEQGIP